MGIIDSRKKKYPVFLGLQKEIDKIGANLPYSRYVASYILFPPKR
jgi:hypothetical protein